MSGSLLVSNSLIDAWLVLLPHRHQKRERERETCACSDLKLKRGAPKEVYFVRGIRRIPRQGVCLLRSFHNRSHWHQQHGMSIQSALKSKRRDYSTRNVRRWLARKMTETEQIWLNVSVYGRLLTFVVVEERVCQLLTGLFIIFVFKRVDFLFIEWRNFPGMSFLDPFEELARIWVNKRSCRQC